MVAGLFPNAHATEPADSSGCFQQQHITIVPLPNPDTVSVQPLHIAPDKHGGALLSSVVAGRAPPPLLGDAGILIAHAGSLCVLTWQCAAATGSRPVTTFTGAGDFATATSTVDVHPFHAPGCVMVVHGAMQPWSWDPEPLVLETLAGPWGPCITLRDVAVDVLLAPPLQSAGTPTAPHQCDTPRAKRARMSQPGTVLQALPPPSQPPLQLLVGVLASVVHNSQQANRVALLDLELDLVSGGAQVHQVSQVHAKQGLQWAAGTQRVVDPNGCLESLIELLS